MYPTGTSAAMLESALSMPTTQGRVSVSRRASTAWAGGGWGGAGVWVVCRHPGLFWNQEVKLTTPRAGGNLGSYPVHLSPLTNGETEAQRA